MLRGVRRRTRRGQRSRGSGAATVSSSSGSSSPAASDGDQIVAEVVGWGVVVLGARRVRSERQWPGTSGGGQLRGSVLVKGSVRGTGKAAPDWGSPQMRPEPASPGSDLDDKSAR